MILANLLREKCVKFVNICAKARRGSTIDAIFIGA